MTFRDDFQKSSAHAERRSGGGRAIAVGDGGIDGLVLIGLHLFFGGNPEQLGQLTGAQNNQSSQTAQQSPGEDPCKTGEDTNSRIDCRMEFTGISVDRVWGEQLPARAGVEYTNPGLVLFESSTQSGCGAASSSTDPFHCPTDQTAHLGMEFFSTLERMSEGNGPFAQEYVVAREFRHHVQKLEGTLGHSNYNEPGLGSDVVKIELQADCRARIWAHYADKGPGAILKPLSNEQIVDALKTTKAIGDDTIQQHSGDGVRPDSWTHGSAKQRTKAFLTGYRSEKMSQCDTLERDVYN